MDIKRRASAGTLESSDVLISVRPADKLILKIESPVFAQYGEQIEKVCREVLAAFNITSGEIHLQDQGALDCTIKARLETAVRRSLSQDD
ncbi:MAG TPA: citrate lyase acyl carrier protein [Clostridiaceae bacterium]|nr:citrate lyase acyl carrier protein [Clostridiaceae bacterium]